MKLFSVFRSNALSVSLSGNANNKDVASFRLPFSTPILGRLALVAVTVSFAASVAAAVAPTVSIIGGASALADSDGVAGEVISITATAADADGSIVNTRWLLNGAEVAAGTSAVLTLPDGSSTVSFIARDNDGAQAAASITYTVQAPIVPLPRIAGRTHRQRPSASQFSIAIRDGNNALVDTAPMTQFLGITGYIFPQQADVNFNADIVVVVATPVGWFMRDKDRNFLPWNGKLATLIPAYEDRQLTEPVRLTIHIGEFDVPGPHRIYVGYLRSGASELIYNAVPAVLEITAR